MVYTLEPITGIHLYSTNPGEPEPTGSITSVYFFAIVALFLVLIAAILTILITIITISYKAYKAATMNPASSLKTE